MNASRQLPADLNGHEDRLRVRALCDRFRPSARSEVRALNCRRSFRVPELRDRIYEGELAQISGGDVRATPRYRRQTGSTRLSARKPSQLGLDPAQVLENLSQRVSYRRNKRSPADASRRQLRASLWTVRFANFPKGAEPSPEQPVSGGQLWAFHGALQHAELMAQGEDLELKRGSAA